MQCTRDSVHRCQMSVKSIRHNSVNSALRSVSAGDHYGINMVEFIHMLFFITPMTIKLSVTAVGNTCLVAHSKLPKL